MSKRKPEHVMDAVNGNIKGPLTGVCSACEPEGKEGHPQRRAAAFCSCQSGTRMYCCSFVVHDTETERARSANAEGCKRNVLVEAYQRAKTTAATQIHLVITSFYIHFVTEVAATQTEAAVEKVE
ncbi:hypothetical protein Tco_0697545 [Tanacetum coccineum]